MGHIQCPYLATGNCRVVSGSARSQVAINLGFAFIKSASLIIAIQMADALLSAQVMGLLLLFRRQGTLWGNLAQLGLSQSLQRYFISESDRHSRMMLWGKLVRWVVLAGALVVVLCLLFAGQINDALFSASPPSLAIAFGIYVAGISLGFMANSSWMVVFRFVNSNLIDWLNGSLLFILCICLGRNLTGPALAFWLAMLTLIVSIAFLWYFTIHSDGCKELLPRDWNLSKDVVSYSLTRALTAFADMATLVIGPWFLRDTPEEAGYLIIAYTVLRLAPAVVIPVAQVLALRANSHYHHAKTEEWRIIWLCIFAFSMTGFLIGAYYAVGGWAIRLWLPNSYIFVQGLIDNLIIFTPAICIFYALRNFIELRYDFPWNLFTFTACLISFVLILLLHNNYDIDTILLSTKSMFIIMYMHSAIFFVVLIFSKHRR